MSNNNKKEDEKIEEKKSKFKEINEELDKLYTNLELQKTLNRAMDTISGMSKVIRYQNKEMNIIRQEIENQTEFLLYKIKKLIDYFQYRMDSLIQRLAKHKPDDRPLGQVDLPSGPCFQLNEQEAIDELCKKLDEMLYLPFKDKLQDTNFDFQKEKFKIIIEETINNLL